MESLSLEMEVMKEDFSKRMQLMKDEIEQRDNALSLMKYKELGYIEKLELAEKSLKALTNESKKPSVEVVCDKHIGESSVSEIVRKGEPAARRKRRNKKKRGLVSPCHDHQQGIFPKFILVCHFCSKEGHIRPRCYKYIKQCNQARRLQKNVRKIWIRKDELREIERGESVRLKKKGNEYVIDISSQVEEASTSKEFVLPNEP